MSTEQIIMHENFPKLNKWSKM